MRALPKSRCCPSSDSESPLCRDTVPRLGASAPVSSLNSVVFPVPFRPTTPHRSPAAMVNVTSENRVVAPNSTATPPTAIWVIGRCRALAAGSRRQPCLPGRLRGPDAEGVSIADERHLQQEGLTREDFQPSVISIPGGPQTELSVASCRLVDQSCDAELLGEPGELATRCGALHKVDEVCLDATFGEEPERFPRVRALLHTKDLNVHACRPDIMERSSAPSFDPVPIT